MTLSTSDSSCDARLLSSGPLGSVAQCGECGQIQLSLAYLTLRLQPDAFRELAGMLAMALQQLTPVATQRPAAAPLH